MQSRKPNQGHPISLTELQSNHSVMPIQQETLKFQYAFDTVSFSRAMMLASNVESITVIRH
jgi:hypothetical protein